MSEPWGPSLVRVEKCLCPGTWWIDGFTVVRQPSGRVWALYGPCDEFGTAKSLDEARRLIRSGRVPQ